MCGRVQRCVRFPGWQGGNGTERVRECGKVPVLSHQSMRIAGIDLDSSDHQARNYKTKIAVY